MFLRTSRSVLAAAAFLASAAVAGAGERLAGPYSGTVEKVVDGDTIAVRVQVWLGQDLQVLVRLRGVDAPELRGGCDSEIARAEKAEAALARLVDGRQVVLTDIEGDKYFGRVVAEVATTDGTPLGPALLAGGHARVYAGGKRGGWCAVGALGAEAERAVAAAP